MINLSGCYNTSKIITSKNNEIHVLLPLSFISAIFLESIDPTKLWLYLYDDRASRAKIFKVSLREKEDIYLIEFDIQEIPDESQSYFILENIDLEHRDNIHNFNIWKNRILPQEASSLHIILPDPMQKYYKDSCII